MDLVFDIETNRVGDDDIGLDSVQTIHCIVAQDLVTEEVFSYPPWELDKGVELLQNATTLIGHNIIGFDIPVLENLTTFKQEGIKIIDTLVTSRLFYPIREGGHSLDRWGFKLGYPKISFEDYDSYSEEMMEYCIRDVQLNTKVFRALQTEGKGFSKDSVELEHAVALPLRQQEWSGFKFNLKKGEMLLANLREKMQASEDEVHKVFKPKLVDDRTVTPYIKKDGTLSKRGMTSEEYEVVLSSRNTKPFMRQKMRDFNLGSRKQIGEYLKEFGWKPKRFTPTGQPIVDESILINIKNIPEAKLIGEYLTLQKRIAQIDSWIKALRSDERVHGFVIPNGTITGRMAHNKPNLAQVPSVKSLYGKECRECWTVEDGYNLVGIDASGLELRLLAHYMDDKEYINEIINGDIHTANQKAAGLESRDQAKTFIYALIYGAGDEKLGSVVKGNRQDGKRLRQHFFDNNPSFKTLRDKVTRAAKKGYLKGLDGRKIFIRSEHAALNSLLQGGGAVIMKKGLALFDSLIKLNTYDAKFVANIHDEWQMEVHETIATNVGQLAVDCIINAGDYYNLRCPMDGEYKVGRDWSETH
jgi:DNA polymerase I-like protein with 3'-5' exonuclease and polymerase domains